MSIIKAPWSQEQINALNEYQNCEFVHPYTCGNSSLHDNLIPTKDGWICPNCNYKQDWAHHSSADLDLIKISKSIPLR